MVVEEKDVQKFHYLNDPMPEKHAMQYGEIKLARLFGRDFTRYISIVHCAMGEDFLVTTDFDEDGWVRAELRDFSGPTPMPSTRLSTKVFPCRHS